MTSKQRITQGNVNVLFINPCPPGMRVVHLPPGLIAVMDLVSRMAHTRTLLKNVRWEDLSVSRIEQEIRQNKAKVLAMPVFSDGHEKIESVLTVLLNKKKRISVVVGGPHIEGNGDSFLKDMESVFRCVKPLSAHVEQVFSDAIKRAARVKSGIRNHRGIHRRLGQGRIRYEILQNAGCINWKQLRPVLITSLGCDRKCRFCADGSKAEGLTFRPIRTVREELAWMSSCLDFPYVMIADDNVLASQGHASQVVRVLEKSLRRNPDLHSFLLARPEDIVSRKRIVKTLPKLQVIRVQLGIESGYSRMRQRYGKGFTNKLVEEAVAVLYTAGVPFIIGSFILGGPHEDKISLEKTAKLITRLLDLAPGVFEPAFAFLRSYPGTSIVSAFPDGLKPIPGIRIGNTTEHRPLFETPSLKEEELIDAQTGLESTIRDHIIGLCDRIEFNTWVRKFKYEQQFQFESVWTQVFREAPNCRAALDMWTSDDCMTIRKLSSAVAMGCRPVCTVEIPISACSHGISLPFGRNRILKISGGTALFLSFCNGNRTLKEVIQDCGTRCQSEAYFKLEDCWPLLMELAEGLLLVWKQA